MDRKAFIEKCLGAMFLALPAYSLVSCSGSDNGPYSGPNPNPNPNPNPMANCSANGTSTAISANHGHTLAVTAADVTAGTEKSYAIDGNSDHGHMVTLTADDFATLQDNDSITVTSTSGGGHTHSVTVSCA